MDKSEPSALGFAKEQTESLNVKEFVVDFFEELKKNEEKTAA